MSKQYYTKILLPSVLPPTKRENTNEPTAMHSKTCGDYTFKRLKYAAETYGTYIAETYFVLVPIDRKPLDFPTFLDALTEDY